MADKKNQWTGTCYRDNIFHGRFIYQTIAMTLIRVGYSQIVIIAKYH